jgi:septum site-determining protein MinC
MPPATAASHPASFDLKSAQWPVVALLLRGTDWAQLQQDWTQRFGGSAEFFDHDPLLVDLSALPSEATPDLEALAAFLRAQRLRPMAYRGGSEAQRQAAERLDWACADEAQAWQAMTCAPAPAAPPAAAPVPSMAPPMASALVVDRPLRSGQQVYARGRDLIVTAMVNPGAEVVADGHIHVYAPLRGKAIAGARGDASARIFARVLEAELVSIAGVYRTSEVPLPDEVRGKAAQIRLDSGEHGDRLLIEPLA